MPVLLYTFGNSDVYFRVDGEWKSFAKLRANLKDSPDLQASLQELLGTDCQCDHLPRILQALQKQPSGALVDRIRFPLVEALIQKLTRTEGWPSGWQWVVVETHQPEHSPYHASDTIGMGRVLKRYLRELERDAHRELRRERNLPDRLLPEAGPFSLEYPKNPSDYAEALDFLRGKLQERIQRHHLEAERFVTVLGPGTPALNLALAFSLVERMPLSRITLFQAFQRRGAETEIKQVNLAPKLKQWPIRQTLQALLRQHDYAGASELLEEIQEAGLWPPGEVNLAWHLCRYGEARLNLDFAQALQHLERIEARLSTEIWKPLKVSLPSIPPDSERTSSPRQPRDLWALLHELLWNLRMTLQRGMYHDLLGRLFRFQELYLHALLAELGIVRMEEQPRRGRAFSDLEPCLNRLYVDDTGFPVPEGGTPLKIPPNKALNRTVLLACFYCAGEMDRLREGWEAALEHLRTLSPLVQLRNRSLIAHGLEPLSAEQLAEKLATSPENLETTLMHHLRELTAWWESHHPSWKPEVSAEQAFETLNQTILDHLPEGAIL